MHRLFDDMAKKYPAYETYVVLFTKDEYLTHFTFPDPDIAENFIKGVWGNYRTCFSAEVYALNRPEPDAPGRLELVGEIFRPKENV